MWTLDPVWPGTDVNYGLCLYGPCVSWDRYELYWDRCELCWAWAGSRPCLTESTGPKANCHLHLNRVMQAFWAKDVGPLTLVVRDFSPFLYQVQIYSWAADCYCLCWDRCELWTLSVLGQMWTMDPVCAGTDVNYGPCLSWDRCDMCWAGAVVNPVHPRPLGP